MKKRIEAKDLITVGIFTAIYFILLFAGGMVGYIPVLYALLPLFMPILCGIPFMLFLTKVKCFGMVTLMGTLLGGVMVLTGHTFVPIVTGIVFGVIADLIFMIGKYSSRKFSIIGYSVFSLWILGMLMPFWVMKDAFEKMMYDSMGDAYAEAVLDVFDKVAWSFPVMAVVGGLIGAFFGLAVLKKHFKKAGIA